MNRNLDEWNTVKKIIERRTSKPPYFKEKEIWWVSIGYNIGHEIYGKNSNFVRPVLIIKKFNQYTFVGIPLSTKIKKNPYYINISLKGRKISALISQIRTFSSKRLSNKLGDLDKGDYYKVIDNVIKLFELPPSSC